jgi:hypothetical protein
MGSNEGASTTQHRGAGGNLNDIGTVLRKVTYLGLTQNRSGVVVIILAPYAGTVSSIRLARTILRKSCY